MTAHITDETDLQRLAFLGKLEPEDLLCELLATIHGDGGHHTDAVGLARAVFDAEKKISGLGEALANFEAAKRVGIQQEQIIMRLEAQVAAQQPSQGAEEPVAEVYQLHFGGRARNIGTAAIRQIVPRDKLPPPGTKLYARPAPEASGAMSLSDGDAECKFAVWWPRNRAKFTTTRQAARAGFLAGISATSKEAGE